jgi:endogenous inhibitor of DNA gyrase (YacG/DUF329 family)
MKYSFNLICPQCEHPVRQLTKDVGKVISRICPECGTNIIVSEQYDEMALAT